METLKDRIWDRVDEQLLLQGKTLLDFSKYSGISYGTIKGNRSRDFLPKTEMLIALSDYLNVSIDWLVKGEGERQPLTPEQVAVRDDSDIRYMVKVMMNDKATLSLISALLHKTELMNAKLG